MKKSYSAPDFKTILLISNEDVLSVSQGNVADPYEIDKFEL